MARSTETGAGEEIVGVMFGSVVHRDMHVIKSLVASGQEPSRLVSRAEMQFMACCDLGPKWEEWAKSPTLFLQKSDGTYEMPHSVSAHSHSNDGRT